MLTKRQENCMVLVWTVIFRRAGKRPTHGGQKPSSLSVTAGIGMCESAEAAGDDMAGNVGAADALDGGERCVLALATPADLLAEVGRHPEAVEAAESFALGNEPAVIERGLGSRQSQQAEIDEPVAEPPPQPRPANARAPVAGQLGSYRDAKRGVIDRGKQVRWRRSVDGDPVAEQFGPGDAAQVPVREPAVGPHHMGRLDVCDLAARHVDAVEPGGRGMLLPDRLVELAQLVLLSGVEWRADNGDQVQVADCGVVVTARQGAARVQTHRVHHGADDLGEGCHHGHRIESGVHCARMPQDERLIGPHGRC